MSLPGATTCLGPTVLTTHPLLAPSLQMGWRNTAVCICVSWGDLYLYTDSWEVLHNIFTNHQKLKYYVIVSSPLNRFPQHPIMKRHHSVFPKCWRPSFASLHINGEINGSELSGCMRALHFICISEFIEKCGIVRVFNTIPAPSDVW